LSAWCQIAIFLKDVQCYSLLILISGNHVKRIKLTEWTESRNVILWKEYGRVISLSIMGIMEYMKIPQQYWLLALRN